MTARSVSDLAADGPDGFPESLPRDEFLRAVIAELRDENIRWPGLWTRLESLLAERDELVARLEAAEAQARAAEADASRLFTESGPLRGRAIAAEAQVAALTQERDALVREAVAAKHHPAHGAGDLGDAPTAGEQLPSGLPLGDSHLPHDVIIANESNASIEMYREAADHWLAVARANRVQAEAAEAALADLQARYDRVAAILNPRALADAGGGTAPDCSCGHPAERHPAIWSIAGDATTRCQVEGCPCLDYDEATGGGTGQEQQP